MEHKKIVTMLIDAQLGLKNWSEVKKKLTDVEFVNDVVFKTKDM